MLSIALKVIQGAENDFFRVFVQQNNSKCFPDDYRYMRTARRAYVLFFQDRKNGGMRTENRIARAFAVGDNDGLQRALRNVFSFFRFRLFDNANHNGRNGAFDLQGRTVCRQTCSCKYDSFRSRLLNAAYLSAYALGNEGSAIRRGVPFH